MPPLLNPIAWQGDYDGYQVIIFLHERGAFSALIIRPTSDRSLVPLRHNESFEAAARAIPGLAAWTDPSVSRPLTDVLPGGPLLNVYRDQRRADGELALPGLVFVGDAVCTTTPNFGRGIATSYLQAGELLSLIDRHGADGESIGEAFDAWCAVNMRPWVQDHIQMDDALARRWGGEDVASDNGRLPSDLIMAATAKDPRSAPSSGPTWGCGPAVEPGRRRTPRTSGVSHRMATTFHRWPRPARACRDRLDARCAPASDCAPSSTWRDAVDHRPICRPRSSAPRICRPATATRSACTNPACRFATSTELGLPAPTQLADRPAPTQLAGRAASAHSWIGQQNPARGSVSISSVVDRPAEPSSRIGQHQPSLPVCRSGRRPQTCRPKTNHPGPRMHVRPAGRESSTGGSAHPRHPMPAP